MVIPSDFTLKVKYPYRLLTNWVESYGFPARKKIFSEKKRVWVVRFDDFWEWAEKNKQMIDFSRFEPLILGPEPEWVQVKRNADLIKATKIKKGIKCAWTKQEDNILKGMLNAFCYTYPDISRRLQRSEGAIMARIKELGLKARPIRFNRQKYTPEEEELIVDLIHKGHCLEDIAERINKSANAVYGKLKRMGYSFKNGVPIKDVG